MAEPETQRTLSPKTNLILHWISMDVRKLTKPACFYYMYGIVEELADWSEHSCNMDSMGSSLV